MNPNPPITVLLAEDHSIVREGLRALLETESDIKIVGEASNGRQAVELTAKLAPAVVVMDIAMPRLNGLEATRQILKNAPATRVLIFSTHTEDAYVEQVMSLGAAAYLVKQTDAHTLPAAIRAIHQGNSFFGPSISKRHHLRHHQSPGRASPLIRPDPGLTARELEVLRLIAEGKTTRAMAAALGIGVKTVEKHRARLMQKLDLHDTAGLTRHAIRAGMIERGARLTMV